MESLDIVRFVDGKFQDISENLVPEARVSVMLNGEEIAGLLSLPEDLEALVLGFLYSEGFINQPDDIASCELNPKLQAVLVTTRGSNSPRSSDLVRSITTGCGRGVTFISPLQKNLLPPLPIPAMPVVPAGTIPVLMKKLQGHSELFRLTGAVHSAALADSTGIIKTFDDIGRHNAIDKIVGWALQNCWPLPSDAMVLSTGRLSSEIIVKVVRCKIGALVSHSAPTLGAIQLARPLGLTVIGFARGNRYNVYCHPSRILR